MEDKNVGESLPILYQNDVAQKCNKKEDSATKWMNNHVVDPRITCTVQKKEMSCI